VYFSATIAAEQEDAAAQDHGKADDRANTCERDENPYNHIRESRPLDEARARVNAGVQDDQEQEEKEDYDHGRRRIPLPHISQLLNGI
jgi:hypothetical protein